MKTYSIEEQAKIGEKIAEILEMRYNKKTGRYQTAWGDKTAIGVFNTVLRIAEDVNGGNFQL